MKRSGKGKELKSSSGSAICVVKGTVVCSLQAAEGATVMFRGLGEQERTIYGRCTRATLQKDSVRHSESGGMIEIAITRKVWEMVLDAD